MSLGKEQNLGASLIEAIDVAQVMGTAFIKIERVPGRPGGNQHPEGRMYGSAGPMVATVLDLTKVVVRVVES